MKTDTSQPPAAGPAADEVQAVDLGQAIDPAPAAPPLGVRVLASLQRTLPGHSLTSPLHRGIGTAQLWMAQRLITRDAWDRAYASLLTTLDVLETSLGTRTDDKSRLLLGQAHQMASVAALQLLAVPAAIDHCEQALTHLQTHHEEGNESGLVSRAYTLSVLTSALTIMTTPDVEDATPTSADHHQQLHRLLTTIDDALQAFDQVVTLSPHDAFRVYPLAATAWHSKAIAYRRLGERDKAITVYEGTIKTLDTLVADNQDLVPTRLTIINDLAEAHMEARAYGPAIEAYERALREFDSLVDDGHANLAVNRAFLRASLAHAHRRAGDIASCPRHLERSLKDLEALVDEGYDALTESCNALRANLKEIPAP